MCASSSGRRAWLRRRARPLLSALTRPWLLINYYGRFYRSRLACFLWRLNDHLVRWACRKYDKRLRNRERRAMELLAGAATRFPGLFAYWRFGARSDGWATGAG